jgi:hypothetical protein
MFEPTATLPRYVDLGYARPPQEMNAAAILGSIKCSGKYFQYRRASFSSGELCTSKFVIEEPEGQIV